MLPGRQKSSQKQHPKHPFAHEKDTDSLIMLLRGSDLQSNVSFKLVLISFSLSFFIAFSTLIPPFDCLLLLSFFPPSLGMIPWCLVWLCLSTSVSLHTFTPFLHILPFCPPSCPSIVLFHFQTAGNDKDSNVQYAELDTSVLTTSSPSHRTSVPVGGDLVEYATIQANVC